MTALEEKEKEKEETQYSRKVSWVKLSQIGENIAFCRENFRGLLIGNVGWALLHKEIVDKTFVESGNTAKFAKVFSREIFRQYKHNIMGEGM